MKALRDDAGVPCSAGGGDQSGDQVGKDSGQKQGAPALEAAQAEHTAHFFKVRRNGAGPGDNIEEDVPLRAQQQENNRANSQPTAGPNQQKQKDGEQSRGGDGGGNLDDRLGEGGKP